MRLCLSFDDGRSDAYDAFRVLSAKHLVASFHVCTGFVDGSFVTDSFGFRRQPLSVEQIVAMAASGMDISSHGDKHTMNDADFRVSCDKLSAWIGSREKIGFSVPFSKFSDDELNRFVAANKSALSYVRVGRSQKCYSFFSKVAYVLYHWFHWSCFFDFFNRHNLIFNLDKFRIRSLVIKKDTRVSHLLRFIEKHKDKDCVLVVMLHSIVTDPKGEWDWSLSDFCKLIDYLQVCKGIEVTTLESL